MQFLKEYGKRKKEEENSKPQKTKSK